MALRISSILYRQLLAQAAASPGREVCGLLVGDDAIERIVPTRNVAADPSRGFEIEPGALFAAIRGERAGKGRLLGYYHSHPVGPPTPSARDAAQAVFDGRVWLIIGVNRVTVWVMGDRGKFDEIELLIVN